MNRRRWILTTGKTGLTLGVYGMLGRQIFGSTQAHAAVKVYRDLVMTCGVGRTKNLPAEMLIAGTDVVVTQGVVEGNHTHDVRVTSAQINSVLSGQSVRFASERGSDDSGPHNITIDPANVAANGGSVEAFEAEGADIIGVRFGNGPSPYLYVVGQNLDQNSIRYCVGDGTCQTANATLLAMELYNSTKGREIYSSKSRLTITDNALIHIFAQTNAGANVKIIAKVTKP
jgi:hypothetical protein